MNLGPGKSERIVVYEGDTAESLADKFAQSHGLDLNMRGKLAQLLDSQIAGLLEKIEEEQNSIHSDNIWKKRWLIMNANVLNVWYN